MTLIPRCPDCDIEVNEDERFTCPLCGMSLLDAPIVEPEPYQPDPEQLRENRDLFTELAAITEQIAIEEPTLGQALLSPYHWFKEQAEEADDKLRGLSKKPD